jgi:hypothetical protein
VTPAAAFAVSALAVQLLLPSQLLRGLGTGGTRGVGSAPSSEAGTPIDDRLGELPGILTNQLGLGVHPAVGIAIIAVVAAGVVIGVRRRPDLDLPLALLAVLTTLVLADHTRKVDRYWFQVTPWLLYFVVVAVLATARFVFRERTRAATLVGVAPLLLLVGAHLVVLPGDISEAQDYNADGRVQFGPAHPDVAPVFDAVRELTPPDAVIAYFRARTMTLLTDRRSFQTKELDRIATDADYFVERANSTYWQPSLDALEARARGFELVWSNDRFDIWATGR